MLAAQKPGEATQRKPPDRWSQEKFYLHFLHLLRRHVVPLKEHVLLASILGETMTASSRAQSTCLRARREILEGIGSSRTALL